MRTRLTAIVAVGCSAAVCAGVFVSMAQAQGGGQTATTWDCYSGTTYGVGSLVVATVDLGGAFNAPPHTPGPSTAPFPGRLVSTDPAGAAPTGLYVTLPPAGRGLKAGITSNEFTCELVPDGSPVPPAISVALAGH
jgi:hypothetical protein